MDQPIDRERFLAALSENASSEAATVAERIMGWADANDLRETFSAGANIHGFGFDPVIKGTAKDTTPITIAGEYGHVFLAGESLKRQNPFNIPERYQELIDRLYAIPQVVQTPDSIYPHIALVDLADEETWTRYFEVIDWVVARIKSSVSRGIV